MPDAVGQSGYEGKARSMEVIDGPVSSGLEALAPSNYVGGATAQLLVRGD
jgi:hypothetical protein